MAHYKTLSDMLDRASQNVSGCVNVLDAESALGVKHWPDGSWSLRIEQYRPEGYDDDDASQTGGILPLRAGVVRTAKIVRATSRDELLRLVQGMSLPIVENQ